MDSPQTLRETEEYLATFPAGRCFLAKLDAAAAVAAERDRAMQAAVLLRRWLRRWVGGGGDFAKAQAEEAIKGCDFLDDWLESKDR